MRITPLVAAAGVALAVALATPALGVDTGNCPSPTAYTGAGTVGDPLLISTPGNLQRLRDTSADWSKYVRLTADIDMAGGSACTWGTSFGPSPAFTGTFDGAGHVVRGLNIVTASPESYGGFIAYLGLNGVVKDLGFTGNVTVNKSGSSSGSAYVTTYAGALVGFTYSSTTIARSWASGQVSSTATATSGGVGVMPMASTSVNTGGIVGYSQGSLTDVYFTGSLAGTANASQAGSGFSNATVNGGGIAGQHAIGTISNAYSTAVAPTFVANATGGSGPSGVVRSGGLLGAKGGGAVTGSFWNADVWAGNGAGLAGPVGTGTTAAGLATFATFGPSGGNWNITNGFPSSTIWGICPAANGGTPFLAAFASAGACSASPDIPATPTAVAGNGQATVTVAQGTGAGGTPDSYLITSSPDGRTCTVTGASGSCDVIGLTNGTSYTFTATATNGVGTSAASAASNAVTPAPPAVGGTPGQEQSGLLSPTSVAGSPSSAARMRLVIRTMNLSARGRAITTGRVPQGATSVRQVARPSAASLGRGSWANALITTTCPITGQDSARTFSCSMRLGSGRWVLTTQARNGAMVVASSARRVVVTAAARTPVTG